MRLHLRFCSGLLVFVVSFAVVWFWWRTSVVAHGHWGVDAVLTRNTSSIRRFGYQYRLRESGVGVLRERDVGIIEPEAKRQEPTAEGAKWRGDVRDKFRDLRRHGFQVVAFAQLPFKAKPRQAGNQLPEDLFQIYKQGCFLGHEFTGLVDAWEMVGEPDIGYCVDLPDRVAAYQKALYLGLKTGARDTRAKSEVQSVQPLAPSASLSATREPLVLMGALGMPPGPWLERAARNGLLDYTDAYNFHFYGHAKDMTGVIKAHRAAIATLSALGRELGSVTPRASGLVSQVSTAALLPLWITEAGIEAVDKKDFLSPQRRQLQADFTLSTAKQALAAQDVAVFMPFILAHDKDPYALTLSPFYSFPAWDAYAKFTKENPWPQRPLARELHEVNPLVMQWLPDNRTCMPHKASGTYRFKEGQPIKGELRIYNFSDEPARGRLQHGAESRQLGVRINLDNDQLEIPAMGIKTIPLDFVANTKGYFREEWAAQFVEDTGRRALVSFGIETEAKPADFYEESLTLIPLPKGKIKFPQIEPYMPGRQVGVWATINALKGEIVQKNESGSIKVEGSEVSQVSGLGSQISSARFWIEQPNTDPLAPTMAVAGVNGLPAVGFLRLQLDKPMTKDRKVLVVLVDDRGQRYTIWENFGADYYGSRSDIWLNLQDFHADFWGTMSADYQFSPERIRELHLRLYLNAPNDPVSVKLSVLKAKG